VKNYDERRDKNITHVVMRRGRDQRRWGHETDQKWDQI
jgi:hypothetical protein